MSEPTDEDAGSALDSWDDTDRDRSDPVLSVRPDGRLELGVPDEPDRWVATDSPLELAQWE